MKYLPVMAVMLAASIATAVSAEQGPAAVALSRSTAECTVEQNPAAVAALLQTLPGSSEEDRAARRVAPLFNACGAELTISPGSQGLYNGRAALAAAAASRELAKGSSAGSDGAVTPWYAAAIAGKAPGAGYDATSLGMQAFGTCVVGAAWAPSASLVASAAGSAEERAAIVAIKPVLAGCVAQGKPIHMTLDQLRLMVAEPLYHVITDGRSAGRS
ncbi:MAG: hypothetical protein ABI810_07535 [Sphingomonas bacterium]